MVREPRARRQPIVSGVIQHVQDGANLENLPSASPYLQATLSAASSQRILHVRGAEESAPGFSSESHLLEPSLRRQLHR